VTSVPKPPIKRTRPTSGDEGRADLVRLLRTQVHSGQYRAEPEHVAEQLVAWFADF